MLCTLTAPVGPNPAPISELLWHLVHREGLRVRSAHLVLESARSAHYVDKELLDALAELRARYGDAMPPAERVHLHHARGADGALPRDERRPELASALNEPLWTAALAAQHDAGEAPVVFGLTGGRRRVSTAAQTMVYQLLGRARDRLVDVRVSLPAAEGGALFFFPEQADQDLAGRHQHEGTAFRAADVEVWVEPLRVPRLRSLLDEADLASYATALARAEDRIGDATPPIVRANLAKGKITIDGHPLALTGRHLVLYLHLLNARRGGQAPVETQDIERLRAFVKSLPWRDDLPDYLKDKPGLDSHVPDLLSQAYSKTRKVVVERVTALLPSKVRWLEPIAERRGGKGTWRLELPRDRIHFTP